MTPAGAITKEASVSAHERLVFVNGKLVPESGATISIFDVGRLYGATFYESIRTFRHKFFKLEEHLRRLEASLAYAGLAGRIGRDKIVEKTPFNRCLTQTST